MVEFFFFLWVMRLKRESFRVDITLSLVNIHARVFNL